MELSLVMKRLGFGKNAHKIYMALLESKKPVSIVLIARRAGIVRPEVYRNIFDLLENGFVKKTSFKKRTLYEAESPQRILDMFKSTSDDTAALTDRLIKRRERELPPGVNYIKGFSGIRSVFDDVITKTKKGETFYRYTSERDLALVNKYLSSNYRAKRDQKKLERLVISNPISGKQKKSRLERFIKFIPPETDLFDQNIIQIVYGNYLAFINLNTEEAIIINDVALASFQKVIFKQLYKRL